MVTHNHYVYIYCDPRKKKDWMQNGMGIPPSAEKLYPELTKVEVHQYKD